MRIHIKTLATLSALALATSVQAQITFSSSSTLSSWLGSPVYTSLGTPSSAGTAQGGYSSATTYGVLAETFTPTSSFDLGSFALPTTVNTGGAGYEAALYDLGPAGTVSVSSSSASYAAGLANLFSVNSVSSIPTSGEVQGIFTLPAADQVALTANVEYALEIWTPVADGANGFTWYRGSTADPGGQMFSAADITDTRDTLAGNGQAGGAPRTGALALYAVSEVPEPSTIALGVMGACSFLLRPRK
jgi:hypothetical protein